MGNKKTDVYEVTVGNIGRVYSGHSHAEAKAIYREYKLQSKSRYGRASGEEVILWKNSEPLYEWLAPRIEETPPINSRRWLEGDYQNFETLF